MSAAAGHPRLTRQEVAVHVAAHAGVLAGSVAVIAWLCQGGAPLSASAWRWFTALANVTPDATGWHRVLGQVIARMPRDLRADPVWALQNLQIAVGGVGLYLALTLAWRLGRLWAAVPAAVFLLAWPSARLAFCAVSADSVLAIATLGIGTAGASWRRSPRWAATLVGLGVAAATLCHPLGLLWGPLLLLAALLVPEVRYDREVDTSSMRPDFPIGDRWLPLLGGSLLAVALVVAAAKPGSLGAWATGQFAILRKPGEVAYLGALGDLPGLGPWLAVSAQWPFAVLALALSTTLSALAWDRTSATSGLACASLVGWITIAVGGLPTVDYLDPVIALAPAGAILAAVAAGRGACALFRDQRTASALVFAAALAAMLAADVWVQSGSDRRALAGHLPGLPAYADALQAVRLQPDDIALLQRFDEPAALLPARPGGAALATAIKPHVPRLAGRSFGAAHAAHVVMLPDPPINPIDRVFAEHGERLACTVNSRRCLYRLVGNPAEPPAK